MENLFTAAQRDRPKPLAAELRPTKFDEIFGQRHLMAEGSLFRRRVASGRLGSVILFGPPGIGKTTIAEVVGLELGKKFVAFHTSTHKTEDIKRVEQEAREQPLLLFVDELHRWNAPTQQLLLNLTEQGVLDLISATTENPFFAIDKALISRSDLFRVDPLSSTDLEGVIRRAIRLVMGKGLRVVIPPELLTKIAERSNGDARRAIGAIDLLTAGYAQGSEVVITEALVEEVFVNAPVTYSKTGSEHYDTTSAFVKAMRGSDPDAALLWLAVLIHSGEDPRYIARRIMIHASEDVGLADPSALSTAVAALQAVSAVGYPEAHIILAHAVLHVARAPKSNSACRGIALALDYVRNNEAIQVPMHLRDTHYGGSKKLGHVGYQYPHDMDAGWADQDYAPGIERGQFYQSDARGGNGYEQRADEFWERITGKPTPSRFK